MRALLAAAIAALFVSPVLAAPSAELVQIKDQMLIGTVQINDNCSGQIIYSKRDTVTGDVATYILTAKHCLDDMVGKNILVDVPTYDAQTRLTIETRYYGDVYALGYTWDTALIKLRDAATWFAKPIRIAPAKVSLYEAESVWAVGYPASMSRTITTGLLNMGVRNEVTGKPVEYFKASPDIMGGSSGGGLYHKADDGSYELIGTTTAGLRGSPFMGLYTTIWDIHAFLKTQGPPGVYKELFGEGK